MAEPCCDHGIVRAYGNRKIPCPNCFGWVNDVLATEIARTMEFGYSPGCVDFANALLEHLKKESGDVYHVAEGEACPPSP